MAHLIRQNRSVQVPIGVVKCPEVSDLARVGVDGIRKVLSIQLPAIAQTNVRLVIANCTGVSSQLVGGSGCGVLIEQGNSTELAEAIIRILDSPERTANLGTKTRRLSQPMGSWHDLTVGLTDLYNRLRAERR